MIFIIVGSVFSIIRTLKDYRGGHEERPPWEQKSEDEAGSDRAPASEDASDTSSGSEDLDVQCLQCVPAADRSWRTLEDEDLQRSSALADLLRDNVLLPLRPDSKTVTFDDLDSGVLLPLAHCAFAGCTWNCCEVRQGSSHLVHITNQLL